MHSKSTSSQSTIRKNTATISEAVANILHLIQQRDVGCLARKKALNQRCPERKVKQLQNLKRGWQFSQSTEGRAAQRRRNILRFQDPKERLRVSKQFKGIPKNAKFKQHLSKLYSHDLTGQQFGLWTVVSRLPNGQRTLGNPTGGTRWLCRCTCGLKKPVFAHNLKSGASKGCRTCGSRR